MRRPVGAALALAALATIACQPPPELDVTADTAIVADAAVASDAAVVDLGAPDLVSVDLRSDDEPLAARRAACAFAAGARAEDTLGPSLTTATIPIDTFVVLVKENRSFDHYFSSLPAYGQADVDVPPPGATVPDAQGKPLAPFHARGLCISAGDIEHSWSLMHDDWDGGKNDGFARVNGNAEPLSYFTDAELPFYYGMASTFSIADHYFASLLGPTGPNRYYLYAATSLGVIDNRTTLPKALPNVFSALATAGVRWTVYAGGAPKSTFSFEWGAMPQLLTDYPDRFRPLGEFFEDAKNGRLPSVVFLRMNCSDEHPADDVEIGQWNTQKVYRALAASPQWPSSALLVTWDEGGGFYDHAPPPTACAPDAIAPKLVPGDSAPGDFTRLGFRVPLLVASAWARPHHVAHQVYDHTSILRLLELRFHLPALTARDANATPPLEMFDFTSPHFATAPHLPDATIDLRRACNYPLVPLVPECAMP